MDKWEAWMCGFVLGACFIAILMVIYHAGVKDGIDQGYVKSLTDYSEKVNCYLQKQ